MRKGLRAGTQLRVGESKSGLVTLAFGGALGVGDRSCVADAPFFGDQAITTTPQQRAPADGSFSRRIFGPALTGASTQSPLAVARSLMNRHSSKASKTLPKCVATPRAVQEETFPFSGTAIRVAPSLIAYFELRVALSGAPREVEERAMAAPPCVAIGCARAGFDAGRLMPGWDAESWGYHGDDGGRFHGDGAAVALDEALLRASRFPHEPSEFPHAPAVFCVAPDPGATPKKVVSSLCVDPETLEAGNAAGAEAVFRALGCLRPDAGEGPSAGGDR